MRTLEDLPVEGRRVLLRADLNVPLRSGDDGVGVADDTRIRAALETIDWLRARRARIVLLSHLGRPHGRDPELSMRPVAERLGELLGCSVALAPAVVGDEVRAMSERLREGEILLLENARYEPGETENDPELAGRLAELADVYVNDAFGTAHRAHASTEAVAHLLPCAAGLLMQREVLTLTAVTEHPARPLVAVLGGVKVSDKLALVQRFLQIADTVLIGGAMSFPFLAAQGHATGLSPCAPEDVESARCTLAAEGALQKLGLPEDLVVAPQLSADAPSHETEGQDVPGSWLAGDIGPRSAAHFARAIAGAGTVFWNGPMGVFECAPFAHGTRVVAEAVAQTSAMSVVGGGETVAAVRQLGLDGEIDHLSTGGGATLKLLQGARLPALEALSADAPREPGEDGRADATAAVPGIGR